MHGGGRVVLGRGVVLEAEAAPIELHAARGANLTLGDDCHLDAGCSIEATSSVTVGARCRLGAFSKIMDNHFHPLLGDRTERPAAIPVVIEDDVEVGERAILLPGAHVGRGSRIGPGMVVRRRVPPESTLSRPGGRRRDGRERVLRPAPVDVSVVIPTFRRPALLVEAVRSALSQDGVNVEILVVDASPEGGARQAVLSLADGRVQYIQSETPSIGGPAIARNQGWPRAQGRYIHFLDDDDLVLPGAYAAQVRALDDEPLSAMSFGVVEPFGEEGPALARERAFWGLTADRARLASRLGRFGVVAMLFEAPLFQNSACLVRKRALEESGGFDPLMLMQEETELHLRTIRAAGCVFVDRAVVRYRLDARSLMHASENASKVPQAYERIQLMYREMHGLSEYGALKVLGKLENFIATQWGQS